jgi:LuxR family maltose regulon positive regulatory protein
MSSAYRAGAAGRPSPLLLADVPLDFSLVSPPPEQRPMVEHEGSPVPPLNRRHLRRSRLTRMLEQSAAQSLLLIAPAGYGKTSLACEWLEGREDVAWFRCTPASADMAALSVGIAVAMTHLVPYAGKRLRERLLVGEAPEYAAKPMAELLAAELAAWPENGLLVIDDYHLLLDSAPAQEFMDWLLTLAPQLRVLVTARQRPPWASARRFLQAEVWELTGRDLAMTADEARELLDGCPPDTIDQIVAQANGWPALIGLAAVASLTDVPQEHISERLYRYFAEEVYRLQRPEVGRFMLVTSVPSAVSPALARDILGAADAETLVEELLDQGLLQPIGATESTFHPLLRGFLRRKLELDAPQQFAALAETVAADAREHRRWEEAIDLCLHRKQLALAAEIVAEASHDLLPAGQIEALEAWLEACGSAASSPPGLLVRSEILFRHGKIPEAHGVALDLARRLDESSEYLSRAWCLAGQTASFLSEPDLSLSLHVTAAQTAASPTERSLALWGSFLASIETESDATAELLTQFETAAPDSTATRLRIANGRALLDRLGGSLEGTWFHLRSLLPLVDYCDDPKATSSFIAYASYVATLTGEYTKAERLARRAHEICSQSPLNFALGNCLAYVGYAQTGRRDLPGARSTVRQIRQAFALTEDPELLAIIAIISARIAICRGDIKGALTELEPATRLTSIRATEGEIHAFMALLLACIGEVDRAREHSAHARESSRCPETSHLSHYALLAANAHHESLLPDSVDGVAQAFEASVAAGVSDTFVTAYRACPALMTMCASAPLLHDQLSTLCGHAGDLPLARRAGLEFRGVQMPDTLGVLTPREREVLALVAEGLSNVDISQQLVISVATTKVHVRHVISKLGARSRLHAALMARSE